MNTIIYKINNKAQHPAAHEGEDEIKCLFNIERTDSKINCPTVSFLHIQGNVEEFQAE